jgi:hypothetical protein
VSKPPLRRKNRSVVTTQRDKEVRKEVLKKLRTLREALSVASRSPKEIEALVRQYEARLRGRP